MLGLPCCFCPTVQRQLFRDDELGWLLVRRKGKPGNHSRSCRRFHERGDLFIASGWLGGAYSIRS